MAGAFSKQRANAHISVLIIHSLVTLKMLKQLVWSKISNQTFPKTVKGFSMRKLPSLKSSLE